MQKNILKKIRVVLSLLFFISITILFLDIKNYLVEDWSTPVLYFQFFPSLLKFIYLAGIASAGFLFVILLTALFGRVYCSSICPLGTFQDIVSFISNKVKKNKYKHRKPADKTRYSLAIIIVLLLLFGISFGVLLLDPFSNFGRFVTFFMRPVIMFINNVVVSIFELFDNYSVFPVEMKGIDLMAAIFPLLILVLVVYLSFRYGRLYCNSICPVGTILGVISRYSFFRVMIEENNCKGCGVCEKVCKAECIDSKNKTIDASRCVECFNCMGVCPTSGIVYKGVLGENKRNKNTNGQDETKRDFVKSVGLYLIGLTRIIKAQQKIEVYVDNTVPVLRKFPLAPPGAIGIEHFTDNCTACHLCISACPTQVLQPSFLEYGFIGMLQPMLKNDKGFCNYECTVCMNVCPAGAILPKPLDEKKLIQIGKAKFIKENCVVETQGTDCGACAEHCPTKAVRMVPYTNVKVPNKSLKIPEVTEDICIGCGACEYACPAKPYKSIYVESNILHLTAKKPPEDKLQEEVPAEEDFPF